MTPSRASSPAAAAARAADARTVQRSAIGVSLAWSAWFVTAVRLSAPLRRQLDRTWGALAVAVVFGPLIHIVMTMMLVPFLTDRAPIIDGAWWTVRLGHIPFVALPIAWIVRGDLGRR